MPRRYHAYPAEWQVWNVMSSMGAFLLGFSFLLTIGYLLWSLKYGKVSGQNPWGAKGLEWEVCATPPHPHNFTKVPVVTEEAYAYTGKEQMDV
jgi:cytochrome c oxidase subunit 1